MRILHITDFHIDDPKNSNKKSEEKLREGNYEVFLNELAKSISNDINDEINFLITTGDYINKGNTSNFVYAKKIIDHLSLKLNIGSDQIYTSIGNHDIIREYDKEGKETMSRKGYYEFASNYNKGDVLDKTDIYTIIHNKKHDIYLLIFDPTFGSKGSNIPSVLEDFEIDNIYIGIKDSVPPNKTIFVLSHYPMDKTQTTEILLEDDSNWIKNHLWKSGYNILHKLNTLRDDSRIFYFHGDGHIPDFWSYSNLQHGIMTAMLGGSHTPKYIDKESKKEIIYNRFVEAKLIEINDTDVIFHTFQYANKSFDFNKHKGEWKHSTSPPRLLNQKSIPSKINKDFGQSKQVTLNNKPQDKTQSFNNKLTELISTSVQIEIMKEVINNELYSFDRHITSDDHSCLGWIDIDSLMNKRAIFNRCVEKSRDWLYEICDNINDKNTLFLGLDYWGSCIASQLSVITNIRNYCAATKAMGRFNVSQESIQQGMFDIAKTMNLENIFLISDVVSTGHSISVVSKIIEEGLNKDLTKVSISIISDINQNRTFDLSGFFKIGTFCTNLRMPVLNNSDLPNEDIVPAKIDLRD